MSSLPDRTALDITIFTDALSRRAFLKRAATGVLLTAAGTQFASCGSSSESLQTATPTRTHTTMQGDLRAHDPSLIKQDNTYYVFSTGGGIQIRTSTDLLTWQLIGTVFDVIPSWVIDAVGDITDLWAPDISYTAGVYHLYYAGSQFGVNTSVIGLATNTTLDPSNPGYHWVDKGMVIQSTTSDDFNAIDPNFVLDANNVPWLDFGSFWTGIKLRRLDPQTFKSSTKDTRLYSLAVNTSSDVDAIEAPFIIYRDKYYYLFASIGFCCRGSNSTYSIVIGRSTSITGPYVDKTGQRMDQGGYTLLLTSYGDVRGPGGESIYKDGGTDLIIYHYYNAAAGGAVQFFISKLHWGNDGWPSIGKPI